MAQPADGSAAGGDQSGIQEILVTAQRKAESEQKVPISISEFSGADLTKLSITTTDQLQQVTPGFNFQSESGATQLTIRGVGTGYSGSGLEGSVALYVDGSYISSQIGATDTLLDIKQIQVLKGPQGALYGRNATGGTVLIDTNDPSTSEFSGNVKVGYGNLSWVRTDSVVNLPVNDTLAFRFAGQFNRRDGYVENVLDDNDVYGQNDYTFRGKVLFAPIDGLTIVGKLEYGRDTFGQPRSNIASGTVCSYCIPLGIPTPPGFYTTNETPPGTELAYLGKTASLLTDGNDRQRVLDAGLNISYDFGNLKLKSVTGLRRVRQFGLMDDQDAGPLPSLFVFSLNSHYDSINEDIQLGSAFSGPVNFTVGTNYQHDGNDFTNGLAGTDFGPLQTITDSRDRTKSYSVFGEVYYQFLSPFTLTVGGRYTDDQRWHAFTNNADAVVVFGQTSAVQTVSYNSFTPRVVLSYDAGIANYYASYNEGFKAGGFNSPSYDAAPPVKPEKIKAYELGAKYSLLDKRIRLDLAVFHYDWSNLQVAIINSADGGLLQQNAASAKADGFESSVNFAVTRALSFSLSGLYLNSRYSSFPDASVFVPSSLITPGTYGQVSAAENVSGDPTPNAPKLSGTAGTSYRFNLSGTGWTADLNASVSYKDHYDMQPGAGGPADLVRQHAYQTTSANIVFENAKDDFEFTLWVDNATQTHYYTNIVATVDGAYGTQALPRTYGFSINQKF
jgi:iron complex outermembrane receptor protein